jgi:hypothetical protein
MNRPCSSRGLSAVVERVPVPASGAAPMRQILSALMQELPQGMPLTQCGLLSLGTVVGVVVGLGGPTWQTLVALMQVLPQGIPF